jgi:hypothetical protein
MATIQTELFEPTIAQRFEAWKATPGGGQVMARLYRITACYYGRFRRTGRGVSQRFLWESLRDRVDGIRKELARREIRLERERGFWLNDHFTAYAVRHMIAAHPEWTDMFELRELNVPKQTQNYRRGAQTQREKPWDANCAN